MKVGFTKHFSFHRLASQGNQSVGEKQVPYFKYKTSGVALACAVFLTASSASALDFYVSPLGSDKNPGSKAKPFQTIAHARDSVAKINSKMSGDIVIYLTGGTYEISESVVFDTKDSGSNGHKVIYKACRSDSYSEWW